MGIAIYPEYFPKDLPVGYTMQQYNDEIGKLQKVIRERQINFDYQKQFRIYKPWKSEQSNRDNAKKWATEYHLFNDAVETAKQNLWNFQRDVQQKEQDAQIKAIRDAIAAQVQDEKLKIIESEKQAIKDQIVSIPEIPKSSISTLHTHSLIIPAAAIIGGLIVLRN
tara:strand:+ start:4909 stop:5406 length:498 start_codon:yes stop_codon:yes gene_type:complete